MSISKELYNQFSRREKILWRALLYVCKLLRENPMADLGLYPEGLISAIPDRGDPEGAKYLRFFMEKAKQEVEEEELEEILEEYEALKSDFKERKNKNE